jgi:Mg2+ and Co2+ transporter CorA
MITWLEGAPITVYLVLGICASGAVAAGYIAMILWQERLAERLADRVQRQVAPLVALRGEGIEILARRVKTRDQAKRQKADIDDWNMRVIQILRSAGATESAIGGFTSLGAVPAKHLPGITPEHSALLDYLDEKLNRLLTTIRRLEGTSNAAS